MNNHSLPFPCCFLDFEASSLGIDSFPIQAAWSRLDGSVASYFLDPREVAHWTDWSSESEVIHQIPREMLFDVGVAPRVVAEAMNMDLAGQLVVVDGGGYDSMWCSELFDAAGIDPEFQFSHLSDLLLEIAPDLYSSAKNDYDRWKIGYTLEQKARAEMEAQGFPRHRADNDVRYLMALYRIALETQASQA